MKFLYYFIILLILNPFCFFVVYGSYRLEPVPTLQDELVFFLMCTTYFIVWLECRCLFPQLDREAVMVVGGYK